MPRIGLGRFAPPLDPVGPFLTTAQRLGTVAKEVTNPDEAAVQPAAPEQPAAA